MSIPVICSCSAKLKVNDALAGRSIKCPRCGKIMKVRTGALVGAGKSASAEEEPSDPNIKAAPGVRRGKGRAAPDDANVTDAPDRSAKMLEESTVPDRFREQVEEELTAGERLIWIGQPDPKLMMMRYLAVTIVLGIICVSMLGYSIREAFRKRGGPGAAGYLMMVIAVGLGVGAAASPFYQRWRAERTCYALTSRRAIVWAANWLGTPKMTNYSPNQLTNLRRSDSWIFKDGAGDVIFWSRTIITRTDHYNRRGGFQGSTMSRRTINYGFLAIRRAREIELLIRETLVDPLLDKMNA